jgi:hypothetical protein
MDQTSSGRTVVEALRAGGLPERLAATRDTDASTDVVWSALDALRHEAEVEAVLAYLGEVDPSAVERGVRASDDSGNRTACAVWALAAHLGGF